MLRAAQCMRTQHPCSTAKLDRSSPVLHKMQRRSEGIWFILQFEGRHIRVDLAAGVSKSIRGGGKNVLYEPGKSVFLGNLPFDVVVSQVPSTSSLLQALLNWNVALL